MDEGEFEIANPEVFSGDAMGEQLQSSCSMDSFFDEILKDTQHACTHTHTCNPPGPDLAHTHTCFHVHTKILPMPSQDESAESTEKGTSSKKRPCGNREAVRKYREKKKAQAASLEDENRRLREQNEHLLKKLQTLTALEAENMRLKCLLVDLRGRIDGEIGHFPYKKNGNQANMAGGAHAVSSCGLRCDEQMYCTFPGMQGKGAVGDGSYGGQGPGDCDFGKAPCLGSSVNGSKDVLDCERANGLPGPCTGGAGKIKGAKSPSTE